MKDRGTLAGMGYLGLPDYSRYGQLMKGDDVFSGIVCCSGSLWFPDWDHYVRNHVIQK